MPEKLKAYLLTFAFTYLIWGGLSWVFLESALTDMQIKKEMAARLGSEDCFKYDQYYNCISRQEFEDLLAGKTKLGVPAVFGFILDQCDNKWCDIHTTKCECL